MLSHPNPNPYSIQIKMYITPNTGAKYYAYINGILRTFYQQQQHNQIPENDRIYPFNTQFRLRPTTSAPFNPFRMCRLWESSNMFQKVSPDIIADKIIAITTHTTTMQCIYRGKCANKLTIANEIEPLYCGAHKFAQVIRTSRIPFITRTIRRAFVYTYLNNRIKVMYLWNIQCNPWFNQYNVECFCIIVHS